MNAANNRTETGDSTRASRVELEDLIEVSARAVQRAIGVRGLSQYPFGTTIGIVFQPELRAMPAHSGAPTSSSGAMEITPQFLRTFAVTAGTLHATFVRDAVEASLKSRDRSSGHLKKMVELAAISPEDGKHLTDMLKAVHDEDSRIADMAIQMRGIYDEMLANTATSPVALAIASVMADSAVHAAGAAQRAGAKEGSAVEAKEKGVASADADGAVEGGGLGAIAGAEVGGAPGGVGALPGAVIGGLIGGLLGGAIKSIGKALD